MSRIMITGASGFLGAHACRHFLGSGSSVRAIVRTPGSAPSGAEEIVVGRLDEKSTLRQALQGVDIVLHAAARVHVLREASADPLSAFREVNVESSRVLGELAAEAGVSHFVFCSSLHVGSAISDRILRETDPPAPQSPYAQSKLEAEEVLAGIAARTGLLVTALRPPLIYGAGVKANMARLVSLIARGVPLPFANIANCRSYVGIANLLGAIDDIIAAGPRASGVFYVTDEHDVSTAELVRGIAEGLGTHARLFPLPLGVLRSLARAGDLINPMVLSPLTTKRLQQLTGNLRATTDRIRQLAGYVPRQSLREGLSSMAAAYLTSHQQ